MSPESYSPKPRLGELLTGQGLIDFDELEKALNEQRVKGGRIGEALVNLNILSESALAKSLSTQLGFPYFDLTRSEISSEALLLIPETLARKYLAIPVQIDGKWLTVAMVDPLAYDAINDLVFYCGYALRPVISTRKDVTQAIDRWYKEHKNFENVFKGKPAAGIRGTTDGFEGILDASPPHSTPSLAPAVRLVDQILERSIQSRASDIHIEPKRDGLSVRFRVDGLLHRMVDLPKWAYGPVTSRIKVLARLDIAERRLPQDGRFQLTVRRRSVDVRVATLPTQFGEKVVLRILDQEQQIPTLSQLGLTGSHSQKIEGLLSHRSGIVLVTGPTGSGKTTTLYSMIQALQEETVNIVTVEDPIEYSMPGINQTQVQPDIGLTFAGCLRSILRQDPNIILLGEIRDLETAEIAFRAAMTGHLVLSTLHTRDSVSSLTRLIDLGVPPYLVSSLLIGVVAQRLVRRLCPRCRSRDPKPFDLMFLKGKWTDRRDPPVSDRTAGCEHCRGEGYYGRKGLFEILAVTPRIQEIILQKGTESDLRTQAVSQGMTCLGDEGIRELLEGETSLEELLRVLEVGDHFSFNCEGCEKPVSAYSQACPRCGWSEKGVCKNCCRYFPLKWERCPFCLAE